MTQPPEVRLLTEANADAAFGVMAAASTTYNPDGTIATFTRAGVSYAVTYDAEGRKSTVTGGGKTKTYNYNGAGQVESVTVA